MTRPLRIFIGHHFYGSGNVGDDLMLAGFVQFLASQHRPVELTCCTPFDPAPMRARFPIVHTLPYEPAARDAAVAACDAWLGLGDSPFQTVVGDWFLDHLAEEVARCRRSGKPMFFLGVGVNDRAALSRPQTRTVLDYATHVWARDAQSAAWLADLAGPSKVTAGSDLAHLYLQSQTWPAPDANSVGYVLNFESPDRFPRAAIEGFVESRPDLAHRWLVQEVRDFPGTERGLLPHLSAAAQSRLSLHLPDYAIATTMRQILDTWWRPGVLVSSRYHGLIAGAWMGSRLVPIDRNDKVRSLAADFGAKGHDTFAGPASLAAAVAAARPVPRDRLDALATLSRQACAECLAAIDGTIPRATVTTPTPNPASRDIDIFNTDELMTPTIRNTASLASVDQLQWPMFRNFMDSTNAFAASRGLRTFTNWSKVWEYPWLWFAALGRIDWAGKHLVDLGTELSPMPWLIAKHGARVTLVETHSDLVPAWEKLRTELNVSADYRAVTSELLPFPDDSVDVVTSFSVIEHQPDKKLAVDEVARVLKPGGLFAVSFDVCQPDMGMTFPEWNGRALTLRESEDTLWLHPAFGNTARPAWDTSDLPAYLDWHRQSAPHHNYATGAAVLVKRG